MKTNANPPPAAKKVKTTLAMMVQVAGNVAVPINGLASIVAPKYPTVKIILLTCKIKFV